MSAATSRQISQGSKKEENQFDQSFDDDSEMLLRGTSVSDLDMKSNEKHTERWGGESDTRG